MRHQGFIPWDDDVDLGMPRKDFESLNRFVDMKGRYEIETYSSKNLDYCYPYAKIYDTTTTLVEHKRINVSRGVFIDIFPLDVIGDSIEESYHNYKIIEKKYRYYLSLVAGIRKGRSFTKNLAVLLARLIPFGFANQIKVRIQLNRLCTAISPESGKYGGNLFGAYGKKEIVKMSLFEKPIRYPFEDMMLCCPSGSEEYLEKIYGNWRELPPIEKRFSHHDFISLDLNHPYKQ
jgi:lipopolysaccharide cholinephosphotransferase